VNKTRKTTRAEKIVRPGVYEVPVYEMDPKIRKLAKKAGFVIWGDAPWGPGKGHIDWSCNYDEELVKFAELLRKEYAKKD
jgi:hypothetical protein